jgi:uncharacterized protein (DUF58 family)
LQETISVKKSKMENSNDILFYNIDNLDLIARQVVEGFIIGLHKSPFHGFSVEFAEHKLYNTGEPIKNIDWKVYGRSDKLFVKKYEEETNLRCQLVIDNSTSMYYPELDNASKSISKIRFSIIAAACLQQLLKRQRDAVGLSVFSNAMEYHAAAKSNPTHQKTIQHQLHTLLQQQPKATTTNVAKCLHEIAESIHRRSMVIIFSDMFESGDEATTENLFSALQHLRYNNHEVILFDVYDGKHEMEFEFENRPYQFVDLETGEKLKLNAMEVKEHYVSQMKKYKQDLKLKCGQFKIDFVEADINKGIEPILLAYLLKRGKRF